MPPEAFSPAAARSRKGLAELLHLGRHGLDGVVHAGVVAAVEAEHRRFQRGQSRRFRPRAAEDHRWPECGLVRGIGELWAPPQQKPTVAEASQFGFAPPAAT